jgi:hypothetical protein
MRRNVLISGIFFMSVFCFIQTGETAAFVTREKGKALIIDQTGEKWDVTQATSIGFDPHRFQYGIGRNAFTPLNDSHLKDTPSFSRRYRVIGIADGAEAQAYSVSRLRRHEIANTTLGSKPIAVGY